MIGKKEFIFAVFNLDDEIFVVYIVFLISLDLVYHSHKAQIASLKIDQISIVIWSKYTDFIEIFSLVLIVELLKYTKINDYVIELIDGK